MTTKSPVYMAVEQILSLFDLSDKIELFSYRDDFAILWELDSPIQNTKSIWCVVDDSFGQFRWLPIGVWGHYYRAKGGFNSPRLILIGEDEGLNPKANIEAVFVPDFYRKEEDCIKTFKLTDMENSFILNLYNSKESLEQIQSKEEAEAFSPKAQSIEGWKGIIRNTLSLPEKRHRISNEIAPTELAKAILNLRSTVSNDNKTIIHDFSEAFIFNREQEALLEIWKWVSGIDATPSSINLENYLMKDIWNVWSNAKCLLIDDQGKSCGYDKILICALSLMTGNREVQLECWEVADDSAASIAKIVDNYDCLFLDLRLTEEDQVCKKYDDLTGVKIAKKVAERSPSFPVIIYSSSQQREITNILSGYKNIIESFRKPGIAGSKRAISGSEALRSLFASIKLAMEMIENNLAWYELNKVPDNFSLECNRYDNRKIRIRGKLTKADKRDLFKQVFWKRVYDKAFTYPYSYFEELFSSYKLLNYCNRISFISNNPSDVTIINSAQDIADAFNNHAGVPDIYTDIQYEGDNHLKLSDLKIEEWTPGLNLSLRLFHQVRNLAAHRLQSFDDMRRQAIVLLLIFARTLRQDQGKVIQYADFAGDKIAVNDFPIFMPCRSADINNYLRALMREVCYFGGTTTFREMYELSNDPD